MPGFITHYFFGTSAFQKIKSSYIKNIIQNHLGVYCFGQQGPDIFLYHIKNSLSSPARNISSLLHETQVASFFYNYTIAMETMKNPKNKEIARAYLCGLLGHYYLDSTTHPYIYYRANYIPGELRHNQYNFYLHGRIETNIDIYMLKHYKQQLPSAFHQERKLHLTKHELNVLSDLLSQTIQKTYFSKNEYKVTKGFIKMTYFSMKLETFLLHSHFGVRKKILHSLEAFILKYHLLSATIATNNTVDTLNSLNLNHTMWYNPWNMTLRSRESFFDLYKKSKKSYLKTLELLDLFFKQIEKYGITTSMIGDLITFIGDCSYHSGLSSQYS